MTVESIDPISMDTNVSLKDIPCEIQSIVRALYRSLGFSAMARERERNFNANVAHELRTPISELQATTDVDLRYPESWDALDALRDAN